MVYIPNWRLWKLMINHTMRGCLIFDTNPCIIYKVVGEKKTLRLMFLHPAPPKLAQVFKYTNRCGKPMGFPRKMIHTWCVFHIYVSFPQANSFIVFYIRTLSRYHPASLISRSYLEHVLFGRKWTTKFTGSKRRRKTRWNGSCLVFFSLAYHQFCLRSHMDQWDYMDLVEKNMSDVPMKY